TQGVSKEDFLAYVKANDAVMRNMQTQVQNMQNQLTNLTDFLTKFVNSNNASTSSSGTLPCNTIANPRSNLKEITTRSEATKDKVHPPNNGSTKDVQPQVVQSKFLILTSEPVNSLISEPVIYPVSALRPNLRPLIPYPSRMQDQKHCDKANDQREKFFQIFKDLNFNISFVNALILMPKFSPSIKSLLANKDKLCDLARTPLNEHCSAVLLKKLPEKLGDPDFDADPRVPLILGRSFLKTGRALIDVFEVISFLKKLMHFLLSKMILLHRKLIKFISTLGDILLLQAFLNDDPSLPPPNQGNYLPEVRKELKICEAKPDKSSIDEPLEVELKDLPPHLEYAFLEEEDFEPVVQHQRRVNPKIHDVIKQEVLKLLDDGLIYPISDTPWVSPVHCVPKKGGFTVVENEDNELISTHLVTSWRICIDYHKLNDATRKDHFPLSFMDQMLERLARNQYYCFLDGFSGYFQ
nr:reverse transcriptase domain-containing protein [Tanacetum cinerariifolium]